MAEVVKALYKKFSINVSVGQVVVERLDRKSYRC